MLIPDVTLSKCYKTKLIARPVLWQNYKIYWPIFQQAELVFFRASIGGFKGRANGAAAPSSFLAF